MLHNESSSLLFSFYQLIEVTKKCDNQEKYCVAGKIMPLSLK